MAKQKTNEQSERTEHDAEEGEVGRDDEEVAVVQDAEEEDAQRPRPSARGKKYSTTTTTCHQQKPQRV